MPGSIERGFDDLIDHYVVICLFLGLFILTWVGVGDVPIVSMLGLILCAAGLAQQSAQADLWILVPLILYNLISMISSWAVYGNITDGYGALQSILPVIYLLMACLGKRDLVLLKRLCTVWTGVVAGAGIVQFVFRGITKGSAVRLGGLLGNPNAMGIFLAAGWFALLQEKERNEKENPRLQVCLTRMEPVVLIALALTLSMGSFAAMGAGILVILMEKKRRMSWRELFFCACRILSKVSLGMGIGVLIYLSAARTGVPWCALFLFLYALAVVACWKKYEPFLEEYPKMAVVIAFFGLAVAAAVVVVRPSSVATFAERLEMMRNGLGYLTRNPLLGVGPYQWRMLNMYDGDKYFNTWHIHNTLIHVGVEFGWGAMAMLALSVFRFYKKGAQIPVKAGFTAFCLHNMIDTSFFYLGITSLVLMIVGEPQNGGKRMGSTAVKAFFGIFAVMFACNLFYYLYALR